MSVEMIHAAFRKSSSMSQHCQIRSLLPPGGKKHKYLQDILHSDVHLQILLTVSLQPVVGKPVVIRCSEQIAVITG